LIKYFTLYCRINTLHGLPILNSRVLEAHKGLIQEKVFVDPAHFSMWSHKYQKEWSAKDYWSWQGSRITRFKFLLCLYECVFNRCKQHYILIGRLQPRQKAR